MWIKPSRAADQTLQRAGQSVQKENMATGVSASTDKMYKNKMSIRGGREPGDLLSEHTSGVLAATLCCFWRPKQRFPIFLQVFCFTCEIHP